ncbi:MAG TPA: response regulator [Longimicrobium sp.]|jgi:two-component system cell cycle response regulator DivK|uniref:response regulator n=1 Tax=Longimicrobium sp. TaxID=2029185 RepID=UPI002EDA71BE
MSQKLLLVADDQEDNRVILSAILTHKRYAVLLAVNGEEAVAQARQHLPALILMDLQMPVMDGWEATRILKADPRTAHIAIIAVTAEDQTPERLEEAGFCAYLRKPFLPRTAALAVELCLADAEPRPRWFALPPMGVHVPLAHE